MAHLLCFFTQLSIAQWSKKRGQKELRDNIKNEDFQAFTIEIKLWNIEHDESSHTIESNDVGVNLDLYLACQCSNTANFWATKMCFTNKLVRTEKRDIRRQFGWKSTFIQLFLLLAVEHWCLVQKDLPIKRPPYKNI